MANEPAPKDTSALAKVPLGPKLIGTGVALFILSRIIKWLPLGWVDGPIMLVLWLAIIASVAAGAGLWYMDSKRDS